MRAITWTWSPSASIDVITTASPYDEERTQYGVGFEYLRGKVTYAASFSNSNENDYNADTASLSISQDMFGDLTTVSLGFSRGWDDVTRRGDADIRGFRGPAHLRRRHLADRDQEPGPRALLRDDHRGGLPQQPLPPGALRGPGRGARLLLPGRRSTRARERATRSRSAAAGTCPIARRCRATTASTPTPGRSTRTRPRLSYTHPLDDEWTFDVHYRFYTQNAAEFYSDLFPREDFQNFLARDKELASMQSHTLGFGVAYEFKSSMLSFAQQDARSTCATTASVSTTTTSATCASPASRRARNRSTRSTRTSSASTSPAGLP